MFPSVIVGDRAGMTKFEAAHCLELEVKSGFTLAACCANRARHGPLAGALFESPERAVSLAARQHTPATAAMTAQQRL